jgi:hypothetical protein
VAQINLMHKNLIASSILICFLYFSCSKSNQPSPQNASIKIELVSGNNQTDTIGRPLANYIVAKVTKNGAPQAGYTLLYQGSGCNADRMDKFPTGVDGTVSYNWFLAGDVGQQTLKIFVLNAQNQKIDSVTAVSTGLAPLPGWHFSACVFPFGAIPIAFCKLTTGRLFTGIQGKAYLRYSDDNGISWNSVKSLGNSHAFQTVISTPADELFAVAMDNTYYSKDAGQTWVPLGIQAFNTATVTGMVYTATGKLLVSTRFNPLYISLDKGITWTSAPVNQFIAKGSTGPDSDFINPVEDKNGNLYIVGQQFQAIYHSTDGGKNWSVITSQNEYDLALYIDNNNWFYKCINSGNTSNIAISKDNGVTYTNLIISDYIFLFNMSVQSDGNFYYSASGSGVYQANGISNSVKKIYDNEFSLPSTYIVAKNSNIIIANSENGLISYYQH